LGEAVFTDGVALGSDRRFDVAAGDTSLAAQGRGAAESQKRFRGNAGLSALDPVLGLTGLRHLGRGARHLRDLLRHNFTPCLCRVLRGIGRVAVRTGPHQALDVYVALNADRFSRVPSGGVAAYDEIQVDGSGERERGDGRQGADGDVVQVEPGGVALLV